MWHTLPSSVVRSFFFFVAIIIYNQIITFKVITIKEKTTIFAWRKPVNFDYKKKKKGSSSALIC